MLLPFKCNECPDNVLCTIPNDTTGSAASITYAIGYPAPASNSQASDCIGIRLYEDDDSSGNKTMHLVNCIPNITTPAANNEVTIAPASQSPLPNQKTQNGYISIENATFDYENKNDGTNGSVTLKCIAKCKNSQYNMTLTANWTFTAIK